MNTQQNELEQMFSGEIRNMSQELEQKKELFWDESVYKFTERVDQVLKHVDNILLENRVLRIGIVGAVKAGKSSFLNALVFDGKPILPKAPTPMTAALTKLSYDEKPQARVVFYKEYDWRMIEKYAEEFERKVDAEYISQRTAYENSLKAKVVGNLVPPPDRGKIISEMKANMSENVVSGYELVQMVSERGLQVAKYLGKEEPIEGDPNQSTAEFFEKLQDYVGADGKYTPLVNHIELAVNNDMLKGFEIIDTPGLNDPVRSREQATKNYLMECDVVLVLCNVGQFLTAQDIKLISKNLTDDSVAQAYIIGTQLDSGVLQYHDRREKSLEVALGESIAEYEEQANRTVNDIKNNSILIRKLRETRPYFVSARMYDIAKKTERREPLNEEEKHTLQALKKRFSDFDSVMESSEDYLLFSGILDVKEEVYGEVREKKEELLAGRVAGYRRDQSLVLLKMVDDIRLSAVTNRESLRSGDVEKLEKKLKMLHAKIESIRTEIRGLFEKQAIKSRKLIDEIKLEIASIQSEYQEFEVEDIKRRSSRREYYGFLGLCSRTVTYVDLVKTASVADVVEQVKQFGTQAQKLTNDNLGQMFDMETLRKQIKDCVMGAFDLADETFQPNEILIPLENMLEKLTIQHVEFDYMEEVENAIYGEFLTDSVEGQEIHHLRKVLDQQLRYVLNLLTKKLDERGNEIQRKMDEQSVVFLDDIEEKITGNIEKTKDLLNNQKQNIARYDELIEQLDRYKKTLRGFGE